jgi:hypothetical protein
MTSNDEATCRGIAISEHPTPDSYFVCNCMACRVTRSVVGTPHPVNTIVPAELIDGLARAAAFFCIEIAKYLPAVDVPLEIYNRTQSDMERRRGA